ncbi:MAG: CysS/YqeB C-terminal domain-containing protein [Anaerolineae bacterium]
MGGTQTYPKDRKCLPGLIALFGSGETAPTGRAVHEYLFRRIGSPIRVAVLETPAGFQPNAAWVAGRLAEFIQERLQNYHPQVTARIEEREAARRARDWARADAIREELARMGYVVEDTPQGPRVRRR